MKLPIVPLEAEDLLSSSLSSGPLPRSLLHETTTTSSTTKTFYDPRYLAPTLDV